MAMDAVENFKRAVFHEGPEWVPDGREVQWVRPPVVERPPASGLDAFGCAWELEAEAEGGTYPAHGKAVVEELGRWRDRVQFPDPGRLDWGEARAAAARARADGLMVQGFVEMGLLERTCLLLGMEEALVAFMEEPGLVEELVSRIADYKVSLIERFWSEARPDIIWYGDDWGSQRALLVPPRLWRRIIKPHTQRIYEAIGGHGMIVNQHSCGMVEEVFGDMVEMGARIWNPCQPCNDLAALKRRHHGKICFWGGIDSQFVLSRPDVTAEEVRREVRRRIDELAWGGGGYIAAPSHGVPYRPEVVEAMRDEIRSYGAKSRAGGK